MDFIEEFLHFTVGKPTPDIYRKWTAIAGLGAALERRVWTLMGGQRLFPNLYVMLVGKPSVGKTQAIVPMWELWRATKKLHISPKSATKASLLDDLVKASTKFPVNGGASLFEYNSLQVCAPEFSNFITEYDNEFLGVLNDIYDNPEVFDEHRRTSVSVDIVNPQLSMIMGAQPSVLSDLLPDSAWNGGFMSRTIMIYAASKPKIDLWKQGVDVSAYRQSLVKYLVDITRPLHGEFQWDPEAQTAFQEWYMQDCPPIPNHPKLENYNGRRYINVAKLAMIAGISRTKRLEVGMEDFVRARSWLLEAEMQMPNVFLEMVNRTEAQVLEELQHYMWQQYSRKKSMTFHQSKIIQFLQAKIPHAMVMRVMEIAEKGGFIERLAGTEDTFIPVSPLDMEDFHA